MIEPSYAFLLRCWKEPGEDGELRWRFSLVYINEKRHKKGFVRLEAVFEHLEECLATFDTPAPKDE